MPPPHENLPRNNLRPATGASAAALRAAPALQVIRPPAAQLAGEHAARSGDLRRFIEAGKKIVISTVQKFPFILDEDPDPGKGVWPATEETEFSC